MRGATVIKTIKSAIRQRKRTKLLFKEAVSQKGSVHVHV